MSSKRGSTLRTIFPEPLRCLVRRALRRHPKTLLVYHELYPSKEALDANAGMENAMAETFAQLDELLVSEPRRGCRRRAASERPW